MKIMTSHAPPPAARKRAPSRRSLETRDRILDRAEQLFAANGYDGTSMRDIASAAGVPVALVNFHGGAKEDLFATVIERRASELSQRRLDALAAAKATADMLRLRDLLDCFIRPYIDLAQTGGPQWTAYARLIAQVSADERWRPISERCFDPTAAVFMRELGALYPGIPPCRIAGAFVFSISAMLSLATSRWRIEAMAGQAGQLPGAIGDWADFLIGYCEGGFVSALGA